MKEFKTLISLRKFHGANGESSGQRLRRCDQRSPVFQEGTVVVALLFSVLYLQSLGNAQPLCECGVICQSAPSGITNPFILSAVRDLRGASSWPLHEETKELEDHFTEVTEITAVRICLR